MGSCSQPSLAMWHLPGEVVSCGPATVGRRQAPRHQLSARLGQGQRGGLPEHQVPAGTVLSRPKWPGARPREGCAPARARAPPVLSRTIPVLLSPARLAPPSNRSVVGSAGTPPLPTSLRQRLRRVVSRIMSSPPAQAARRSTRSWTHDTSTGRRQTRQRVAVVPQPAELSRQRA